MSVLERTLSLLRPAGGGPLVLRVGGDSADHSFWVPKVRPMPSWAFALTPAWLQRTSTLVRDLNLRLILDLNLVTDTPHAAAQWAQAAETQLPRGSIAGFEIGNEPDIYDRDFWLATVVAQQGRAADRSHPRTYARDFQAYARALRRVGSGRPAPRTGAGASLGSQRVDLDLDREPSRARGGHLRPPLSVLGLRAAAARARLRHDRPRAQRERQRGGGPLGRAGGGDRAAGRPTRCA